MPIIGPGGGGGGGGGLALTGWTEDDQDPANVDSNGGNLSLDGGQFESANMGGDSASFAPGQVSVQAGTGGNVVLLGAGVYSAPDTEDSDTPTCFIADGSNGATNALDAGGLQVIGFQGLPTSDPAVAGQLYTTAGAVFVSAG